MNDDLSSEMSTALNDLIDQLRRGAEFPDAAHRVARQNQVDQAELEAAYDQHCASR